MSFGGRSRIEVEYDVLGAMVLIPPFRLRACGRLTGASFSTSDHRALFHALAVTRGATISDAPGFVARSLGMNYAEAEAWLLNSLPTRLDGDLNRLTRTDP